METSPDQMVSVCDICGDPGFEEMLAVCSKCNVVMEHMYCMQAFSGVPFWEREWLCEGCKQPVNEVCDSKGGRDQGSVLQQQKPSGSRAPNASNTKARLAYDSLPSFLLDSRPKDSLGRLEQRKKNPEKNRQSSGLRPVKEQDVYLRPETTSHSSNAKHIKESPDVSSLSELKESPCFKGNSLSERTPNAPIEKDVCVAGGNPHFAPQFWAQPQRVPGMPVSDFCWRGGFEVVLSGHVASYGCLQAHASDRASHEAFELSRTLPSSLELHPVARLSSWPKKFRMVPPNDEDIALYFFPAADIRYEAQYGELLERVMRLDVLLGCFLNGAKLVLAPSSLLIPPFQCWKNRMYLWGFFQRVSSGAPNWAFNEDMDCT